MESDHPSARPRLSDELDAVLAAGADGALTLGELSERLEGRALGMILLVVGAPFLVPMPSPGFSTPAGFALALLGLQHAFGARVGMLPLLHRQSVPSGVLDALRRLLAAGSRRLDWLVRPRLDFHTGPRGRLLVGAAIVSASLALAVPGPASNVVPALALVSLALGVLGRDGLFLAAGAILSVASWIYVGLIVLLVARGIGWLRAAIPL